MVAKLSRGSMGEGFASERGEGATVQVLEIDLLPELSRSPTASRPRCRLLLHDGESCMPALLASPLTGLVTSGQVSAVPER